MVIHYDIFLFLFFFVFSVGERNLIKIVNNFVLRQNKNMFVKVWYWYAEENAEANLLRFIYLQCGSAFPKFFDVDLCI